MFPIVANTIIRSVHNFVHSTAGIRIAGLSCINGYNCDTFGGLFATESPPTVGSTNVVAITAPRMSTPRLNRALRLARGLAFGRVAICQMSRPNVTDRDSS
ncbi:unnamed protein product, partial [Iphiclides podalirius]